MKHNSYIKIVMLVVVVFASCNKYLDKKADSSKVVPTTIEDLQALLDNSQIMNTYTPSYGTGSADDHFLLSSTYDTRSLRDRNTYTWQPTQVSFEEDWSRPYFAIYNTNLCLEQLEKVIKTASNTPAWNNVKGSALFFRSYYFSQLAWVYAKAYDETSYQTDLGIVIRLGSNFNVPSNRSTVKESYERVIADAKESIQYLPTTPTIATRPSQVAAYALLARTYLSMRKYDSCLKYANLSLSINNELIDYNSSDVAPSNNVPFKLFNKETVFMTKMSSSYTLINPTNALTDTTLYKSYKSDDIRQQAFFRTNGLYKRFKGSYVASSTVHFSGITTAEMYLTRAECYARLQNIAQAMADLNTLMIKRWKKSVTYPTFTAVDSQDALTQILSERRKELLFRGLRWMDIKRLNKEGANIVITRIVNNQPVILQPNDNRYALPLPSDIIELTGMPQN